MAEVALTPLVVIRSGVTETLTAANSTSGQEFVNDGHTMLLVKNVSSATVSVSFEYQGSLDGGLITVTNPAYAVGNGVTKIFGPFPGEIYNDSSGNVEIDYTGVVASVSVAAIRL